MTSLLAVHEDGGVVSITIDRPERRNALNDDALNQLLIILKRDYADARAIVIRGQGDISFSAGSDIKELSGQTLEERIAHTRLGQDVADAIESHSAPVIAAIEGFCLGGGLELALACDLRVVADGATLGLPEVQINGLPSWGGTFRLSRIVGLARAKELILFGKRIGAVEAVQWGIASESTTQGDAYSTAISIASKLSRETTAVTVGRAKTLVNAGYGVDPRVGRELELLADSAQLSSDSFEESFGAFGK